LLLKSVSFGNSVTSIEECAFSSCPVLQKVTIPATVTSIGNEAFRGCLLLKRVNYLGVNDPGASSKDVFKSTFITMKVCVNDNYNSNTFCGEKVSKSC